MKLISLTTGQRDVFTINYAFWKLVQGPLDSVAFQLEHASAPRLVEEGYNPDQCDGSTLQSCQLAAATARLVLASMRTNLTEDVDHSSCLCRVLKCIVTPQWEFPAATIRSQVLKSGDIEMPACLGMPKLCSCDCC